MARKVLKRESTKAATPGSSVAIRAGSAHQNIPVLSGDTIVIDNDSENTIVDGPVDEGYQTNLENKNDCELLRVFYAVYPIFSGNERI